MAFFFLSIFLSIYFSLYLLSLSIFFLSILFLFFFLSTHHHGEADGDDLDSFDHPQDRQTEDLDDGEDVDPPQGHVTHVRKIGLVLNGLDEEEEAINQLKKRDKSCYY